MKKLSREHLDALLKGVEGEAEHTWWNDRLRFAHSRGKITDKQLRNALTYKTRVVKRYLWSMTTDPEVRQRMRTLSVVSSKLWHRLGALVNMCAIEAGDDVAALEDLEELMCGGKIHEHLRVAFLRDTYDVKMGVELRPLVQRVLDKYPQIDTLAPVDTSILSSWHQAKSYIVNKYYTTVALHVHTHFMRRLKATLRDVADYGAAMKYLYGGPTPVNADTKDRVDAIRQRLKDIELWDTIKKEPKDVRSGGKLSRGLLRWHLELCRAEGATIQPFPLANMVSRAYVRVDSKVFSKMFTGCRRNGRKLDFHEALGLTQELWNARRKLPGDAARKKRARGVRRSVGKLRADEYISSVETDGYGVSIVINRPQTKSTTPKDKEQRAKDHLANMQRVRNTMDCYVDGLDPGRVNLAVTASKCTFGENTGKVIRWQYSRAKWKSNIGDQRQKDWETARRSIPEVKAAMDALSDSGGKRNAEESKWVAYLDAMVTHWPALVDEFMENDERAARRMVCYRRKQRVIEGLASRVVHPEEKSARIVGYGDGSFASHGRGSNDTSVPVKKIYKAIRRAFKTHRKTGGVVKVWEYLTTAKCHACEQRLEKMHDANGHEIRDFRRCTQCTFEERPKLRNRDFNAARNILKVTEAMLVLGADSKTCRPSYLCPERRKKTTRSAPSDTASGSRLKKPKP
jgi:hypothetical protein